MVKDNIMKMTDGLFYQVFEEIGAQYPQIQRERYIIDIGAAKLATKPELFDVIVTPNLYGDILSDIAAEMTGGVGLAGSANIGEHVAMFEAIHGSAPDIAGQDIANPSGLLLGAVMMLVHIGQHDTATKIHNAWLRTLEEGIHTSDLKGPHTTQRVGTQAFADAVIARLGQQPQQFKPVSYSAQASPVDTQVVQVTAKAPAKKNARKELVGVDIFLHASGEKADALASQLQPLAGGQLKLQMITNRGVKVWPGGFPETFCTDHWRCRFVATTSQGMIHPREIVSLLGRLTDMGLDVIKTENLCTFDGERGFALGQGQ
jgi:isocitrate dehydrogenase